MPKATKRAHTETAAATRPTAEFSAATDPGKSSAGKPTGKRPSKPAQKAEELTFKVTPAFKQSFKQAAKDLGLKKGALLEKLLADWHSRPPVPAERALAAPHKPVEATQGRRNTGRG